MLVPDAAPNPNSRHFLPRPFSRKCTSPDRLLRLRVTSENRGRPPWQSPKWVGLIGHPTKKAPPLSQNAPYRPLGLQNPAAFQENRLTREEKRQLMHPTYKRPRDYNGGPPDLSHAARADHTARNAQAD